MDQQREVDITEIQRRFPLAAVQGNASFFMRNPLKDKRLQDANARRAMDLGIIVRRTHAHLLRPHTQHDVRELYLVWLAPLTRQLQFGAWELTPAGQFFPVLKKIVEKGGVPTKYQGRYAAKYGCTTTTAKKRFADLIHELLDKGFPEVLRAVY